MRYGQSILLSEVDTKRWKVGSPWSFRTARQVPIQGCSTPRPTRSERRSWPSSTNTYHKTTISTSASRRPRRTPDHSSGTYVHLTRLEDDLGSRSAGQLGSLPDQRVEEVDGVVVTDGVDGHVPVDAGY
jgi:hypothetical protein